MRERHFGRLFVRLIILAAASLAPWNSARSLAMPPPAADLHKVIVIGFVGGFVRHDDTKHAEVQFAARLRDRYASAVDVEVFGNHSGQDALRHVLALLDTDRDGILTAPEKEKAKIIIFGHSWGGTETVLLARALQQQHIPVLLTIQVDSISKPGQGDVSIPANVAHAVNFYQSNGLLHGRPEILATDPERTNIIGNFHMTYKDHPVNCDQFPWFARTFTKPHLEIENDPQVWAEAASLIDAELSGARSIALAR
jgi:pimeloyl-ACP methyl ester carboxylesterase